MENQKKIICPSCGTSIDVQEIISHQLEEEFKKKYNSQIKEETKQIEEKLKIKLNEEHKEGLEILQMELAEKSSQTKELNKIKVEIEILRREKNGIREEIEAETQIKLTQIISEEKEKIRKTEEDKNELRFKDLHKQLADQKILTEEMKRKQDQGSMQLQGEVQELAIEEWLKSNFPLDIIEEIKKGVRGGDCIQIINTRTHQNCGTIYYESKRTKDFQPAWIEKFKTDIREKGADIGVLVTNAMPSDMERMGMKDGIYICTYDEFKGLCAVLRYSIIQINNSITTQENKGEKMSMLYDYLTTNAFRSHVEAIVEGLHQMKVDLVSEKSVTLSSWKKREKQIEKIILNTIHMHASIKGIAGNAIQSVKALEFTEVVEGIDIPSKEKED